MLGESFMSNATPCRLLLVLFSLLCTMPPMYARQAAVGAAGTTPTSNPPVITKIDPPNWWATMPKPMLLMQGQHLEGARFSLSDRTLHLERTHISENGDWAELWLAADPTKAETI